MATPSAMPRQARSQPQRIHDLTRERDRMSTEIRQIRGTLSQIRDLVFTGEQTSAVLQQVRKVLGENWEHTRIPGRCFDLVRHVDKSGVSGTGRVAEGFEFEDGTVAARWLGPDASTNVYQSVESMLRIHGHGGSTEVQYR